MSSISGYVLGGLQIVAGVLLTVFGAGAVGVPLIVSGAATTIGTALTPSPPREKTLRDSPNYGIDRFENPSGPDAVIPIIYGAPRIKPVLLAQSVTELVESHSPATSATRTQGFRWLGVLGEGEFSHVSEIQINDRDVLRKERDVRVGRGGGGEKRFALPHRWVYLGDDEAPGVEVWVDGALKSWRTRSASASFTSPAVTYRQVFDPITLTTRRVKKPAKVVLQRDDKRERILSSSLRVYVRGPGHPETEEARQGSGYRWRAQKLAPHKVRITFGRRPPPGWTIRVTYDYLASDGLAVVQDEDGKTRLIFGSAPANGARITARYATTPFHGLRVQFRPGSLDQQPIDGFTDLEVSRNPSNTLLTQGAGITYSTAGREVDDLRIGLVAPRGLIQYETDDNGGTRAVSLRVRITYRVLGASSWKRLPGAKGDYINLIGERASPMRWEIGLREQLERRAIAGDGDAADALAAFEREAYEVRVSRLTAVSTDSYVVDELRFQYVTEILREGFTYPGTGLIAISGIVTSFLGGESLRVSCRAHRAELYDPRPNDAGDARDLGSSRNPALAIRDLLTSSEGVASERFGGGSFFTGADVFLGAAGEEGGFVAFADFCDAWVHRPGDDATRPPSATNGERRCRLDVALDTPQSLIETIGDLAFLGYCMATFQGARVRFPLDQDGDAVFTFVDDIDPRTQNMTRFILRTDAWGKTPTAIEGSFWNEALDFERDQLLYPVDGLPAGAPPNVRQVDLRGVSRETEAARLLRHLAEQASDMPYPCTWDAHPGVQHVEAGDIVEIKTRVPYATGSDALTLNVRVLAAIVGRDDDGKVVVRFAGRALSSSALALSPVSVPVSREAIAGRRRRRGRTRRRRLVTGLRARVS